MHGAPKRILTGLFVVFCLAVGLLGVNGQASQGGGKGKGGGGAGGGDGGLPGNFDVTFGDDSNFCGGGGGSDRICSDTGAAYADGDPGIDAHFSLQGNFTLNPDEKGSERYFLFSFDDQLPNPPLSIPSNPIIECDPSIDPDGDGLCNFHAIDFTDPDVQAAFNFFFVATTVEISAEGGAESHGQTCDGLADTTRFIDMSQYQCLRGKVHFQFSWTKKRYGGQLRLRAGQNDNLVLDQEGTDDVRVFCEMADTDGCIEWTLTPCGPAGAACDPDRTELHMRLFDSGDQLEHIGDFNMPFSMTITRPII